ncbi:carbonic anhydrase [Myxozyma melibiosi]|uniref:Carbonic anhydrase n=1 Tax=Myxozyma melibiosi TaxID=54550 RepID=A0ABR1F3S9_9ASCO
MTATTETKIIKEVTAANAKYAASFTKGSLPLPPGRKFTVVTCMDARLDPAKALGLEEGDAHVIRNAGGRAKDALRSVIISQQLLGTEEVLVIHHTDCGMLTFKDEELHEIVKERFGNEEYHEFLSFPDLEKSVKDDVEFLRESKVIKSEIPISGWIYEVETGKIRPVKN